MKRYLLVSICIVVLIAFSSMAVYAQTANKNEAAVSAKIDSLSKDIAAINAKLDQLLTNQEKFSEELKTVKVLIRRM
ncbi:MAG: hypothetical protein JW938_07290 [Candidatus Omnitrophica bacterium]|nr:hypothetical protein [Candidatus Omnitrophota bacterium]